MIGLIVFLVLALSLFVFLIIRTIRTKKRKNFLFLIVDAFSILLFLIYFIVTKEHSVIITLISVVISIISAFIIIILEKLSYTFIEGLLLLVVNTLVLFGNNRLAKSVLNRFLRKKPHSFIGHKRLGEILKKEGGTRKALNEYIIAINLKEDSRLFLEVAEMFYDLGNKDEAKDALIYILTKEPTFLDGQMFLSKIYLELEQYKDAARTLNDALKLYKDKGNYDIYYQLGELYAKLNDFKASKENFEKAYEIRQKDIIQMFIAQILLIENEEEKAIEIFKEIIDVRLLKPYILYELARVAVYRGEDSKAVSYVNEAIKLDEGLKERALNDYIFFKIRNDFVLSVKLDDEEIENIKEKMIDQKADKAIIKNIVKNLQAQNKEKPTIFERFKLVEQEDDELTESEIEIIKHFSNTSSTITNMGDITSQEKTKTRVDKLFKQKLGQIEVEGHILDEQEESADNDSISQLEERKEI